MVFSRCSRRRGSLATLLRWSCTSGRPAPAGASALVVQRKDHGSRPDCQRSVAPAVVEKRCNCFLCLGGKELHGVLREVAMVGFDVGGIKGDDLGARDGSKGGRGRQGSRGPGKELISSLDGFRCTAKANPSIVLGCHCHGDAYTFGKALACGIAGNGLMSLLRGRPPRRRRRRELRRVGLAAWW